MIKKIATAVLIQIAQLIAFTVYIPRWAQSESFVPSIEAKDLYKIESEYMKLSDFPKKLVLYDILMIDLDRENMKDVDEITADIYLPLIPENLDDVILFDGWHVAHFSFERISDICMRVTAKTEDLALFDGTVGLYLFVTGYED